MWKKSGAGRAAHIVSNVTIGVMGMRTVLMCAATAVMVITMTSAASAQGAPVWPWCAVMTLKDGLSTNCGFANVRQCEQTINGIGGWCEPNPRYWAEAPRHPERRRYYR
jgi:hypothetical protein